VGQNSREFLFWEIQLLEGQAQCFPQHEKGGDLGIRVLGRKKLKGASDVRQVNREKKLTPRNKPCKVGVSVKSGRAVEEKGGHRRKEYLEGNGAGYWGRILASGLTKGTAGIKILTGRNMETQNCKG